MHRAGVAADAAAITVYDELYGIYVDRHDSFGGVHRSRADWPSIMKRLLAIRERAIASPAAVEVVRT